MPTIVAATNATLEINRDSGGVTVLRMIAASGKRWNGDQVAALLGENVDVRIKEGGVEMVIKGSVDINAEQKSVLASIIDADTDSFHLLGYGPTASRLPSYLECFEA